MGSFSSLTLSPSGALSVSYHDASSLDLKYATQVGDAWLVEVVDSNGEVGSYSSLTIDGAGDQHISYFDIDQEANGFCASLAGQGKCLDMPV